MDAEEDPGEGETKEEEFPFDLCCCSDDEMPDERSTRSELLLVLLERVERIATDDILLVFSDDILTLFLRFGEHISNVSSFPRQFRFKEQIATKCIFRLTANTKATN
mmetsp:Transcript_60777/g.68019  ORF Transcript_60777/g.68019 Transcript_60777/m.68019 type:complete len:107 (-) Transcript_60777:92-412(-)